MRQVRISAVACSKADSAQVFAILRDGANWPNWSIFDSVELERPGHDEPHGVGAIRVFVTRITRAREEVVELIPDRRLAYVLLDGFPLLDYHAVVEIQPEGGGSRITWSASFFPKYLGTRWFWSLILGKTLRTLSAQLAGAAESPRAPLGMVMSQV
jgi:hypothetical protein